MKKGIDGIGSAVHISRERFLDIKLSDIIAYDYGYIKFQNKESLIYLSIGYTKRFFVLIQTISDMVRVYMSEEDIYLFLEILEEYDALRLNV